MNTQALLTVTIDAIKLHSKNTLRAFMDITLPDLGLCLKGVGVHQKENSRWISLPSRSYSDSQGTHYAPVVEFATKESRRSITEAILRAYDDHQESAR